MNPFKNLSILCFYFLVTLFIALAHAARFDITNNCSFTIWAGALPGGGREINKGGTWSLEVAPTKSGRIWARTNCSFNGSGIGTCQTGDCGGLLQCEVGGSPPVTIAEYRINQIQNGTDIFDISVVDGFNVPMAFSPTTRECTGTDCTGDLIGLCPKELKVPGGCKSPCAAFNTPEYCCTGSVGERCKATNYSIIFKGACPGAFSYSYDEKLNTYTCPSGTNYRVVFCPGP